MAQPPQISHSKWREQEKWSILILFVERPKKKKNYSFYNEVLWITTNVLAISRSSLNQGGKTKKYNSLLYMSNPAYPKLRNSISKRRHKLWNDTLSVDCDERRWKGYSFPTTPKCLKWDSFRRFFWTRMRSRPSGEWPPPRAKTLYSLWTAGRMPRTVTLDCSSS